MNSYKKAIFYIDGFNLYFGLKQSNLRKYYWLNLEKLCEKIIAPYVDQRLVKIKYFTAKIKNPPDKAQRQDLFIQAIETSCTVEIFYGRYSSNLRYCSNCNYAYYYNEEKKTDVEIAANMLGDAHKDLFDIAYLISGDSDLTPVIREIKALSPQKLVIVSFPPHRVSHELMSISDGNKKIKKYLSDCEFPDQINNRIGVVIQRPSQWH
jgi:uncharacterized LabA/DUF88 family protein